MIDKLVVIEPKFCEKAPTSYWNIISHIVNLITQNKNIYYSLPHDIKNNPIFNLELQCSTTMKDVFLENFKNKEISQEKTIECLNAMINYIDNFKKNLQQNNLKHYDYNSTYNFIKKSNLGIALESFSLLATNLDEKFLKSTENRKFRNLLLQTFTYIVNLKDIESELSKTANINFLSIFAHYPQKEVLSIVENTDISVCDILSSCYNSNISETKQKSINKLLESFIIKHLESNTNEANFNFILQQINHSFYINIKNKLNFNEMCEFLSIVPLSKLQDSLNPKFIENNYNYYVTVLSRGYPEINNNAALESILSKVMEIKMYEDIESNKIIKTVSKKPLKF